MGSDNILDYKEKETNFERTLRVMQIVDDYERDPRNWWAMSVGFAKGFWSGIEGLWELITGAAKFIDSMSPTNLTINAVKDILFSIQDPEGFAHQKTMEYTDFINKVTAIKNFVETNFELNNSLLSSVSPALYFKLSDEGKANLAALIDRVWTESLDEIEKDPSKFSEIKGRITFEIVQDLLLAELVVAKTAIKGVDLATDTAKVINAGDDLLSITNSLDHLLPFLSKGNFKGVAQDDILKMLKVIDGSTLNSAEKLAQQTRVLQLAKESEIPLDLARLKPFTDQNPRLLEVLGEGTGKLVPNVKNIDDFIAGVKSFDEVLEDYSLIYRDIIDGNKTWSWNKSIHGGENLTLAQKSAIKAKAVADGLIDDIAVVTKVVDGKTVRYADFKSAGVVIDTKPLPQELWHATDTEQFAYLDELIGGKPEGTTWHHSLDEGTMELVPFGIHNITNHNGGRTIGQWAYIEGGR